MISEDNIRRITGLIARFYNVATPINERSELQSQLWRLGVSLEKPLSPWGQAEWFGLHT